MKRVFLLISGVVFCSAGCNSSLSKHSQIATRQSPPMVERVPEVRSAQPPVPPEPACTRSNTSSLPSPDISVKKSKKEMPKSPSLFFSFRDCSLGDSVNEASLLAQGYKCQDSPLFDRLCYKFRDSVGDTQVMTTFSIMGRKLAAVSLLFKTESYLEILSAFTAKYGVPHDQREDTVQNRMGATFTNEISVWHTESGDLKIQRYSSRLTDGSVDIYDPKAMKIALEREKEKAAKAAKDL